MDRAISNVLNKEAYGNERLLALLILEVRAANETAQEQKSVLQLLVGELQQTRNLIYRIAVASGIHVSLH